MKFTEAKQGRTFILKLEDGDKVPTVIEDFAELNGIQRATVILVGAVKAGSHYIAGPEDPESSPITPFVNTFTEVHEILGTGIIAPLESGKPILHMHAAFGRDDSAKMGCLRAGVEIWKVGEVVVQEILTDRAVRRVDSATGFTILDI